MKASKKIIVSIVSAGLICLSAVCNAAEANQIAPDKEANIKHCDKKQHPKPKDTSIANTKSAENSNTTPRLGNLGPNGS